MSESKNVTAAVWRTLRTIGQWLRSLVAGIFGPPAQAFVRLLATFREWGNRILAKFLEWWANIFSKGPATPRDPRPTPGRAIIPLLAAVIVVAVWYVAPLHELVPWTQRTVWWSILGSWLGVALLIRQAARASLPGRITRWIVAAADGVGLHRFERIAFILSAVALWRMWPDLTLRPAPLLLTIGFGRLLGEKRIGRPLPGDLPEIPDLDAAPIDEGMALHTFSWTTPIRDRQDPMTIDVAVDVALYEQMRAQNPGRPVAAAEPDFTPWIVDGVTPEVLRTAHAIRTIANQRGYGRFEEASAVLAFVQSIEYSFDEDSTGESEYWRYPIETLHDETGDCEDTVILAAAVLRNLGHDVIPLVTSDHAALGIAAPAHLPGSFLDVDGRRYYFAETTGGGHRIGDLPVDVDGQGVRALRLPETASTTVR